jgi:DNA-binding transcriptional LysR family regulator
MDVRDLEVFLSVAKHLNFTRAGDEVHLSQPSISVRVRKLEGELNVKLFEQLGKRVALTEAGQVLVPYAHRVVAALDDARHAVEELQGLERGTLRIGASTTPGMYLVPKIIARFKRQYPKIDIRLEIKDTRQIEEEIVRNEFDFGFVGGHLISSEVEVIPLLTDEIVLVAAPGSQLTQKKQIRVSDLKLEQFISREQGSATQAAVDDKLRAADLQLKTVMEMNNPEAVKKAVQSGLGVAFLSRFAVETELKAKTLVAVKVKDFSLNRELKIVYRKEKHLSRAAQAFIKMCDTS